MTRLLSFQLFRTRLGRLIIIRDVTSGRLRAGAQVVVFVLVCDDQHHRIVHRPLYVFPRRTSFQTTAPVVSPDENYANSQIRTLL